MVSPLYSEEVISPDTARYWLSLPVEHQRATARSTVARYRRDMLAGQFPLTAIPVQLNDRGGVIDGRHRLTACVESGVPLHCVVARGADEDTFGVLDRGNPRHMSQFLRGKYVKLRDSAARLLWVVEHDLPFTPGLNLFAEMRPEDQLAYVESWPELEEYGYLAVGAASVSGSHIPSRLVGAVLAQAARGGDGEMARSFGGGLEHPGNYHDWIPHGDPRYALKERFRLKRDLRQTFQLELAYTTVVKAYNLLAEGRTATRGRGAQPRPIPGAACRGPGIRYRCARPRPHP
jgi:hypothetical protein